MEQKRRLIAFRKEESSMKEEWMFSFTASSGFPKAKGHTQLQQLDNSI
jgi:hypothetical protein